LSPRRDHGRVVALAALLLMTAAWSGCGYQLSGHNRYLPPTVKTIAIPVFVNETRRAEIEQRITESLLNEFIKRGDYLTQPQRAGADAVLEGAVTGYSATPVTLNSSQGTAERVEVVVQARVRLSDLHTGKILWSQEHFIFRSQYAVDQVPSGSFDREIVAIDRIARGFAETVVTSLLEGF
jgi:outer membrane lipopolysaccharide assembly protein LptE/RlpB